MMTEEDREILNDLKAKLSIDQFELEKECCEQPIIYEEVGCWVASVKARSKIAKEHVSFVESDLSLRIRKNPESFDLSGKPTVDAVIACVKVNSEYKQAFQDYIEADRLSNEASTLLESVAQRKSSIRDLVRLYVNDYFSRADEVTHEEWRGAERAILELRNKKAVEKEDVDEDRMEEE